MPIPASAQPARAAELCTVVIFGASGDLTQRKLVPALYNLRHDGLLPDCCELVGFTRRPKTDQQFRDEMRAGVAEHSRTPIDAATWDPFATNVRYHQSDFDDLAGYQSLRMLLDAILDDATLFIRRDEVEAAWSLVTPIMDGWSAGHAPKPAPYWSGSLGPDAADALIGQDGRVAIFLGDRSWGLGNVALPNP